MNFILRSTQLQTECGRSREYQYEGFGQRDIVSSCWIYSWFISHEELSGVSVAVIFRERDWFELWWPWCSLQP
jgi:hypothetical protein